MLELTRCLNAACIPGCDSLPPSKRHKNPANSKFDRALNRLRSRTSRCSSTRAQIRASRASPSRPINVDRTVAGATRKALFAQYAKLGRASPRLAPEVRRILEFARPHTNLPRLGPVFLGDIVERVFAKGDGLAPCHHLFADVHTFDAAQRHHASVAVSVAARAGYPLAPDLLGKRS